MRVLQIGSDRSKRGILYPGSPGFARQEAYAKEFGSLDIVAFARSSDGVAEHSGPHLCVVPTYSWWALTYGLDAMRIAKRLPKPDVVSAQDPFEAGLVAWWIAKRFNVPLHVQVHTDFLSERYTNMSLKNRIRIMIAVFVLKRAAGIRVVSEKVKRVIETRYRLRAPMTVLPIFVDIEQVRNSIAGPELVSRFTKFTTKLLVVSRLEQEKNVAVAIDSFAKSTPNDACLIVVGTGSERARLEQKTQDLGVSDRIFFEGEQPSIRYYPLADLVLVTSKYEGYGLVIVEALAAGKPVLSTNVGIAREAGAIVSDDLHFADALANWFKNGPRTGELKGHPYANFDEYVRAYCDDIRACTIGKISL